MSFEDLIHPLLKYYLSSPQWVKSSIGAAYARIPATWRYGGAFPAYRREVEMTDPVAIQALRREKLATSLRWAIETVPAYGRFRDLLKARMDPEELLSRMPLVSKLDIKADLESFVSAALPASARLRTFTGGSTANPMMFYLHRGVTRSREFAYIQDFDRRSGVEPDGAILALRGRSVRGAGQDGKPLWMYEPIKRHLILSSDHLEPRFMPGYVDAMRQWRPTHVQAFPSALYPLARWFREHPAPEVTNLVKSIQLTSENVYEYQLEAMRDVFHCPIIHHYGHSERVLMATTLPGDWRFFLWPLYGWPEIVDTDGTPIHEPGRLGELVGTSFDNQVMPFVRYRTGDMAMWAENGRDDLPGWQALSRIEGRLQEFVVCTDERLISVATIGAAHFDDLAAVETIQYEQREPGKLTLKVVSGAPIGDDMRRSICDAVRKKTQGGCEVELERVSEIPRTERGKHKMLIQHLDISHYLGAACLDDACT